MVGHNGGRVKGGKKARTRVSIVNRELKRADKRMWSNL